MECDEVGEVERFKFLGYFLDSKKRGFEKDMTRRTKQGWMK